MVLATNRPADLDPAVLDRMDEALEFPLPGRPERRRILQIYLDSYLARAGTEAGARAARAPLARSCPQASHAPAARPGRARLANHPDLPVSLCTSAGAGARWWMLARRPLCVP